MGTYTHTCIDGYPLVYSKNALDPLAMSVFREHDRREYKMKRRDLNRLIYIEPEPDEADEEIDIVEYTTTVASAAQRLDVMGFTMRRCRDRYEEERLARIEEILTPEEQSTQMDDYYAEQLALLRSIDFDSYVEGLREVVSRRLRPDPFDDRDLPGLSEVVRYILGDHDELLFGFFSEDLRALMRVACSISKPDGLVTQDITDLAESGYIDKTTPVCQEVVDSLVSSYPQNAPRIILTEGSSDSLILQESLAILFPHLVGYFTFFDFVGARAQGGASQLVHVVKAFAAAGIANRVIALLDNDTAAKDATRSLTSVTLPPNIAVLHYPDTNFLRSYPTLGPSGLTVLDVNGTAASIELYLGVDVLMADGKLTPVQWAGYNQTLNRYQGEVMGKDRIRAAWEQKAAECKAMPVRVSETDWSGLRLIWESVFQAFDDY